MLFLPRFDEGYLDVGDTHQIFYAQHGSKDGVPLLFLHGGPGLGTTDYDARFFPEHFRVIRFDQRGSGRSKASNILIANTTDHLLQDIVKLLDHLKINQKVILFGGSWGSTLAMLFAIRYPEKVLRLVLRGVFLATKASRLFFERKGVDLFFPEEWEQYTSLIPEADRENPTQYYCNKMLDGTDEERALYSRVFSKYAITVSRRGGVENIDEVLKNYNYLNQATIQAHYFKHDFFIPEGYIPENISQISETRVDIVHGRYDLLCLPKYAYQLNKLLKNSKLYLVDAGHSSVEPETEKMLRSIMATSG